ncbi:MAG: siroheme synthase, partial [Thiotrichaceae bacterium]|nr:siroheme synthase [Thiotrichaceae bacterium]
MKHFPVFLDLKDRQCLVIGGGSVASRKAKNLLTAEAKVTVISPEVSDELKQLG